MYRKYSLVIFLIWSSVLISQNKTAVELFPAGLHFLPLKANNQEARIGILYYPENASLKVDVGNTIDLIAIHFDDSKSKLSFGIEFMAYALSTSFEGKRLQIDALDGFFGGNAVFSRKNIDNIIYLRFRFIHNSAHLVDGSFLKKENRWKNDLFPIPYTKDFGELTIARKHTISNIALRYNVGFAYAALVRPLELEKFSMSTGFEIAFKNVFGKIFNRENSLFFADQLSFEGTPKYIGSNNLIGGIKFGDWDSKGVIFYLSYYSGRNMFSEYYYERISKFGIGFFIDFI
ncbi:MAG: hypothetical protein HND52_05430 [Ignavibacteriae bacterium]|nr:hypothetical protein [Ignavibacteriota bacterium]NOG97394.1 hypothetical protein [Ignavibacteriota bacterium]